MNPANTLAIAQARVLAVTAPAVGADPMRFLRRAGDGPRGFWARSDRWIAHSGALATVSAEGTHPGGLFSGIEANALALFDPGSVQVLGGAPGLRFFGGFAFRPGRSSGRRVLRLLAIRCSASDPCESLCRGRSHAGRRCRRLPFRASLNLEAWEPGFCPAIPRGA